MEAKAKIGSLDPSSSIASVSTELPIETAYCGEKIIVVAILEKENLVSKELIRIKLPPY